MFFCPAAVMAYPDGVYVLQPQTFLFYGHGHPQCPLFVLKSISGYPGCTPGKLDVIQNYENIRKMRLVEKTRKREKIWLIGGYDHFFI
jgi:hypothetical protein